MIGALLIYLISNYKIEFELSKQPIFESIYKNCEKMLGKL